MKYFSVFFSLLLPSIFFSQTFTWMKGSNVGLQPGNYGTLGVASPSNNPGCRHGAATWTDQQGNLWLFGGEGYDISTNLCWLNDLWKYNVSTNLWTWMGGSNTGNQIGTFGTLGVPSSSNQPGAREFAMKWTDAAGNFWLFGGDGFASNATFGRLADLWKYNPSTNQWTWVNGFNTVDQFGVYGTLGVSSASNQPGSRYGASQWADGSGNLWMFGGRGFPAAGPTGFLNDLWKYNLASNQWTWMGGSNLINQNGNYGTLNTASVSNCPGGNEFASYWFDSNNFYLFGGRGFHASGGPAYLNSFWKYNLASNQWTWIGGTNSGANNGVYGTLGVPAASVSPGSRMSAISWNDGLGNLWLFAGEGLASSGPALGYLNDLFRYQISTGLWTWIKGSSSLNQVGVYGTQTVPANSNMPGGRQYNSWWPCNNGKCWLIGAIAFPATNAPDNMEDLWKFTPSCNSESITAIPGTTICSGVSVSLTTIPVGTTGISWFNLPSGGVAIGTGTQLVTPVLQAVAVNSVYTYYSENGGCTGYPRTQQSITVSPSPTVVLSGNSPICSGQVYSCWTSGTAVSYTWNNGSNANTYSATLSSNTPIIVQGTGTNGCVGQSSVMAVVLPLPTVAITGNTLICQGSSAILNASGSASTYTWSTGSNNSSISVTPSNTSVYQLIGKDVYGCSDTAWHTLNVAPLPIISISSKTIICSGEQAILNASGALSYTWNTGTSGYSTSVTPTVSTTYTVTGTSSFSCINTSTFHLLVSKCNGLDEVRTMNEFTEFNIYPNPCNGNFTVQTSGLYDSELIIHDLLGKVILYTKCSKSVQYFENLLLPGIYNYTFRLSDGCIKNGKLIVN